MEKIKANRFEDKNGW